MLNVLLQPNLVCGDLRGNARLLANAVQQYLTEQTAVFSSESPLFLTPAGALAGYPWQPLYRTGGFFQRCQEAAAYLARLLAELPPSDSLKPRVLISLPGNPVSRFLLLKPAQVETLYCSNNGILECEGLAFYLPEQDESGGSSAKPDAVLLHQPRLFYAQSWQSLEQEAVELAHARTVPVLCVNACGATDSAIFMGQSCAFASNGDLVARAPAFTPAALALNLQGSLPQLLDDAMAPAPSQEWPELVFQACTLGIRDYVRKCGLGGTVIGLSGGMDSALVALMAVEALGADQVMALLMPSPYSSDHSVGDALQLAANLGIRTHTVPISAMMDAYSAALRPAFAGLPQREGDLGEENIQARIRGATLMAFANRLGWAVLGTGNKSENAVGYCTLYGDTVGALEPLGDMYKSDVYRVARWYNAMRGTDIIPGHILTKAPSAELRPDQTDQDSLPPYEVLDAILAHILEDRGEPGALQLPGVSQETILRVTTLLTRAEFKRHQSPPALRLSSCLLGEDWRMPVAARL